MGLTLQAGRGPGRWRPGKGLSRHWLGPRAPCQLCFCHCLVGSGRQLLGCILGTQLSPLPQPGTFPELDGSSRSDIASWLTEPAGEALLQACRVRGRGAGRQEARMHPPASAGKLLLPVARVWPWHDAQRRGASAARTPASQKPCASSGPPDRPPPPGPVVPLESTCRF